MVRLALVCAALVCSAAATGCHNTSRQVARNPLRGESDTDSRDPESYRFARVTEERSAVTDAVERTSEAELPTAIDGDLDHLSTAERREVVANLATLDPATAKMVMRTIRLARNSRDESPESNVADTRYTANTIEGPASRLVGGHSTNTPVDAPDHSHPSRSPVQRTSRDAGLGQASPWPSHAVDSRTTAFRPTTPEDWPAREEEPVDERTNGFEGIAHRLDGIANRLTGRQPVSAANRTPLSLAESADPQPTPDASSRTEPSNDVSSSPDARTTTSYVDHDQVMPASFSTALPGPHTNDDTSPAIPLAEAIRRFENELTAMRSAGSAEPAELVEKSIFLRMLYLMDGQEERALVPIAEASAAEQAFWSNVMWAMANAFDREGIDNDLDRSGQVVTQLRQAVQALQPTARLELRNVNFCSDIASYGNYTPFDETRFRARERVLVYAEVENFQSEPTLDGDYETRLKSTAEFYRAGDENAPLATIDFPVTTDRSRNHRRDYFLAYDFLLPQQLAPGRYTLLLKVEDELSRRSDTHVLKFEVTP